MSLGLSLLSVRKDVAGAARENDWNVRWFAGMRTQCFGGADEGSGRELIF